MLSAISWQEIITILLFLLMVIGAGFAALGKLLFWMVARRVKDIEDDITALSAGAKQLETALGAFRLKVAEEYATHMIVVEAERNMAEALKGVYARFDTFANRIDDRFNNTNERLDSILLALPAMTAPAPGKRKSAIPR